MNIKIKYIFSQAGLEKHYFEIVLDKKAIQIIPENDSKKPEWTHLAFHQCPHCPLDSKKQTYCPTAENLVPLVTSFDGINSHDTLQVEVITAERRVLQETSAQRAIGSIMGIIFSCSGCPRTIFFRPMARFHLPLATEDETVFRAISIYLINQYFQAQGKNKPDFTLEGLNQVYRDVQTINTSMAGRIRAATTTDSSINAVIFLDMFAKAMPYVIKNSLHDLRYLFEPYLASLETSRS